MEFRTGAVLSTRRFSLILISSQMMILLFCVNSTTLVPPSSPILRFPSIQESNSKAGWNPHNCHKCNKDKDIEITTTYVDASGEIRTQKVKSRDLSASWIWESADDITHQEQKDYLETINAINTDSSDMEKRDQSAIHDYPQTKAHDPVKVQRWYLRQKRKDFRTLELIQQNESSFEQMETEAVERSRQFNSATKGKYSIWRREYDNPHSDSTLKLMKDQIIMAKVYASIAHSKKQNDIYNSLTKQIRNSRHVIGEANSDPELPPDAIEQAKSMGHILLLAKDRLYDCAVVARKLRAMVQFNDENVDALKKKSTFLIQLAAKTVPKPLHCLSLSLTTDYYLLDNKNSVSLISEKLDDPNLFHYAIFSDNVLATSVAVNSTVINAKEPEKHVFHIVTDRLNFASMKMWFLTHQMRGATVHVENIDEFRWLNSSYCSVLRQLESARLKEYYFKMSHPSSLSAGDDNLKYRNPKYLSMLNHLRFYMPEVYPKLDKILFLDDDIVIQKDLTPLWSINMNGMVNAAVETCKQSFHRFETYLNFSNPLISQNFDPKACGWAFGMNIFDLKEWKKRNITGIYHHWQDLNDERQLWKLGSLPPGLITFYNLTYPLDRSWHVLGLGYDPAIETSKIQKAAVIHYNGNYKPWLDLAISKYRKYWSKYIMFGNPYLEHCYINKIA